MPFAKHPQPGTLASLADVVTHPYWLDSPLKPEPAPELTSQQTADLTIIGAGFTGLWTALLAKEEHPGWDVVLLESGTTAQGASGRNGGFIAASITHGFENGYSRWPEEFQNLLNLGQTNLDEIENTVQKYQVDCDFLRSGELVVATEAYQIDNLLEIQKLSTSKGETIEWLSSEQIKELVNSPIYLGGLFNRTGVAMADPARLAWGLRRACLGLGVRLFENSPVVNISTGKGKTIAKTPHGSVTSHYTALATNAYPPLLKRLRYYIVPVYDYVLMTEPLSSSQRTSIGWHGRQGVSDCANQFHYYRTTEDGRILWGGYDAIYYPNNGFGPQFETNPESFGRLAEHFFTTFPQLRGLKFSHAWGGAIDTCSRFTSFWGTLHNGRTAYAMGFTGLGVGASRFGAQVMLDQLQRKDNQRTGLKMVRSKPIPFPPEPLRSVVINMTRRSLDRADQNQGRRDTWLQLLDLLGLGFDS